MPHSLEYQLPHLRYLIIKKGDGLLSRIQSCDSMINEGMNRCLCKDCIVYWWGEQTVQEGRTTNWYVLLEAEP